MPNTNPLKDTLGLYANARAERSPWMNGSWRGQPLLEKERESRHFFPPEAKFQNLIPAPLV